MIMDMKLNTYEKRSSKTKIKHCDELGNLQCRKCKEYKSKDEFYNDPKMHMRGGKGSECRDCQKKRKKIYRGKREENLDKVICCLWHGCKTRHEGKTNKFKYTTLEFNISKQDIKNMYDKQEGKCAISGIKMTYIRGAGKKPNNISVDRIDSSKGYTIDNIQLVCSHINMMKSDLTLDDLILYCKIICNYAENKN